MPYKAFTCTQGGADTAAETTIATGLVPGYDMVAWKPSMVEFTIYPTLVKAWAAADADFSLQMTKRSLAGSIARIVTFNDADLLLSWNLAVIASGTAANLWLQPTTFIVPWAGDLIYAENLYAQIISTATGATNILWGRIKYDIQKLSNSEAVALLAARP
jgi:hypothetical protein